MEVPEHVTLLHNPDVKVPEFEQVLDALVKQGLKVDVCTLNQKLPVDQGIISLIDLAAPLFNQLDENSLTWMKNLLQSYATVPVLWLTRSAQIGCANPGYGLVMGATRTIRMELLNPLATLEVDAASAAVGRAVVKIYKKLVMRDMTAELEPDYEYALVEDVIYIPRFRWFSVDKELTSLAGGDLPMKVEIKKQGFLQSLCWVRYQPTLLKEDSVLVELHAAGLNFKVWFPVPRFAPRSPG
jgi:hypothetical protein